MWRTEAPSQTARTNSQPREQGHLGTSTPSEASTTSRETASESGKIANSFKPLSFEIVRYTEIDSRNHYYHYQQPPSFI